jgi:RNA methyltransferase, TrmH family
VNPTAPLLPPLGSGRRKLLLRLRSRKLREREGLVLVEGPRAVATALDAGARFRFAVVSAAPAPESPHDPRHAALRDALADAGVELASLDPASLAAAADTETPQGILAVVEEPAWTLEDIPAGGGLVLVLDRIQDPGNAGTLVRTAAAFGAAGVVSLDGTVDPWNPKAVRASAGASFSLPVVRTAWADFDAWRRTHRILLLMADASGTDVRTLPPPDPATPAPRRALLVGNEGQGPRAEARAATDIVVALPLAPGVESLNAAMAGSILLWALGPAIRSPAPAHPDSPAP